MAQLAWPHITAIDEALGDFLARESRVFRVFDRQDSGCVAYGVEAGAKYFVKGAISQPAIAGLERAIRLNRALRHPLLPPLLQVLQTPQGPALVYAWREGEHLYRGSPDGGLTRFLALDSQTILSVLDQIYALHVAIAALGWVMVDFYDGCLLYDFATARLSVFDLDEYRSAPFVLDTPRLPGSGRFMAPEESQFGAHIDQLTNVYTLGRCARVLLGDGSGAAAAWRGNAALNAVVTRATACARAERYASVAELAAAWRLARGQSLS